MTSLPLRLCFKGERTYVHGTDILTESLRAVQGRFEGMEISSVRASFQRMCTRQLRLEICPGEFSSAAGPGIGTIGFRANGEPWRGDLLEEVEAPQCRYAYAESDIGANCHIEAESRRITLERSIEFSPIEVIVAMTKVLHVQSLADAKGSWVFSGWESERWLEGACTEPRLEVRLTQRVGTRLTRSDVLLNARSIGRIYFSLRGAS